MPENWEELAVLTSSVISDRKIMFNQLAVNALLETKRFLSEVCKDHFEIRRVAQVVKSFEKYFNSLLFNTNYQNDRTFLRKFIDHEITKYFVKEV